jgi:hypothetical protein
MARWGLIPVWMKETRKQVFYEWQQRSDGKHPYNAFGAKPRSRSPSQAYGSSPTRVAKCRSDEGKRVVSLRLEPTLIPPFVDSQSGDRSPPAG